MKIRITALSLLFTALFVVSLITSSATFSLTGAAAQQRPDRARQNGPTREEPPTAEPFDRKDPRAVLGQEWLATETMPYPNAAAGTADSDPLGAAEATFDNRTGQETLANSVPASEINDGVSRFSKPNLFPGSIGPNPEVDARDIRNNQGTGRNTNSVIGNDDRVRISPTTSFPWRAMTKLRMTFPSGRSFICSGAMIAAKYTLTAGHCVFSHGEGGWATTIEVIPGLDGSYKPYGSAYAVYMRSYQGWTRDRDSNYDFGLITLDRSIGNSTGWFGYASYASVNGLTANLGGYPGDLDNGLRLYYHSGPITSSTTDRVYYSIDTAGGQSGSSVYRINNGSRYVFAVHTTGYGTYNGGTRITSARFSNLQSWIASGQ
ncbi:MAG: serine protease [Acidobacteria bacterium]|nr:serine protease [Acidobacteriota bacterium]